MTNSKVHLIADEKLGGIQREYIEVDRKAREGDYVIVSRMDRKEVSPPVVTSVVGTEHEISQVYVNPSINGDDNVDYSLGCKYRTLDPTDIVVIDGKRYKLAERMAEVGEKIITISGSETLPIKESGVILEVTESDADTCEGMFHKHVIVEYNGRLCAVYQFQFRVLEPLWTCGNCGAGLGETACGNSAGGSYCSAKCADAREPDTTAEPAQPSESLLDLFAKITMRLMQLEDELETVRKNVQTFAEQTESNTKDIAALDERAQVLNAIQSFYLTGGERQ